ncbi:MAG: hypothetical protein RR618_01195 [Cellulosilyticaceae bacterium]
MFSKKKGVNTKIKKLWKRIQLKDKCLIVMMGIILGQSIYSLFRAGITPNSASIDVVMRTTSASIFGYFLSANFLSKKVPKVKVTKKDKEEMTCICTTLKEKGNEDKEENKKEKEQEMEDKTYFIAQILIAAAIGVISLIVLIIARNIPETPVESIPELAQFRDFVSGCVGFLIGVPVNSDNKNNEE